MLGWLVGSKSGSVATKGGGGAKGGAVPLERVGASRGGGGGLSIDLSPGGHINVNLPSALHIDGRQDVLIDRGIRYAERWNDPENMGMIGSPEDVNFNVGSYGVSVNESPDVQQFGHERKNEGLRKSVFGRRGGGGMSPLEVMGLEPTPRELDKQLKMEQLSQARMKTQKMAAQMQGGFVATQPQPSQAAPLMPLKKFSTV